MRFLKSYKLFENENENENEGDVDIKSMLMTGLKNAAKNNKTDLFLNILKEHPIDFAKSDGHIFYMDYMYIIIEASFHNNKTIVDYMYDNINLSVWDTKSTVRNILKFNKTIGPGDLLFFENEGNNGLLGLVVDYLYEDDEVFEDHENSPILDVYFRGMGGEHQEMNLEEEVYATLFEYNGRYFSDALERGDISAYRSISKKENLPLKREYIIYDNYLKLMEGKSERMEG